MQGKKNKMDNTQMQCRVPTLNHLSKGKYNFHIRKQPSQATKVFHSHNLLAF